MTTETYGCVCVGGGGRGISRNIVGSFLLTFSKQVTYSWFYTNVFFNDTLLLVLFEYLQLFVSYLVV